MIKNLISRFFKGKPIQNKLAGAIIFTSLTALIFVCVIFLITNIIISKNNFKSEINAIFELTAKNIVAPIYFLDQKSTKDSLNALKIAGDVHSAAVYLASNEKFATYIRKNEEYKLNRLLYIFPKKPPLEKSIKKNGRLILTKKIYLKKELLGYLYIEFDEKRYNNQRALYIVFAIITGICAIVISYILSFYLKDFLLVPILNLLNIVKKISNDKDYSIRAKSYDKDEIGELIEGFNHMIERIESRDLALKTHKDTLEKQVVERTMDITNANIELQRLNKELITAKKEADQASAAKSIFLANMSHELRTPLNGIIGYTELLKKETDNLNHETMERVDIINKCGEHLLYMIDDILDLSKVEAGKLEIVKTSFLLKEFINTTAAMAQSRLLNHEIKILVNFSDNLPKAVEADAKRIRQVLLNLLGNSIKFTKKGTISLNVKRLNNKIRFEVADTGIGIHEDQLEKIFLSFSQAGDPSQKAEGTGLGLAISSQLVKLMDGKLSVESSPGVGSRFWFDLNLKKTNSHDGEYGEISGSSYHRIKQYMRKDSDKKPFRVLIVDDIEENIVFLKTILEHTGFEVETTDNGLKAYEKAISDEFDIILMDMVMPEMNGLESSVKIIETLGSNSPLIIAVSAGTNIDMENKALESGCSYILSKPINIDKLLSLIEQNMNLQWEYIESEDKDEKPEDIYLTNPELVRKINMLAKDGDISEIKKFCMEQRIDRPEHENFFIKIETLAKQFKIKEIRNMTTEEIIKEQ